MEERVTSTDTLDPRLLSTSATPPGSGASIGLPELIGAHPAIIDVSRRIRLPAPRSTSVLIDGLFRPDLYYRLAVFMIRTPPLRGRTNDIEDLTQHFLKRFAEDSPAKSITPAAHAYLAAYSWPGNVRELQHLLERTWILAEDRPSIDIDEIEFDESLSHNA